MDIEQLIKETKQSAKESIRHRFIQGEFPELQKLSNKFWKQDGYSDKAKNIHQQIEETLKKLEHQATKDAMTELNSKITIK